MCSLMKNSPGPSTLAPHHLNTDIVIEKILSHFGEEGDKDLLNYRLVCHTWNDIIIRKFKKSGRKFQISLRYDPEVPQLIDRSVATRSTNEVLESTIRTLNGTAAQLNFDTIVVGQGFYLADGVMTKWKELLEMEGGFIRHLKFKNSRNASAESTEASLSFPLVTDCENIVSMECLRATFTRTPGLETLKFCIKFANSYQELFPCGPSFRPLEKLTKITIVEPHGVPYHPQFLNYIFSMTTNLSAVNSKPWSHSSHFKAVAFALNPPPPYLPYQWYLPHRVTSLGIDNATIQKLPHDLIEGFECEKFELETWNGSRWKRILLYNRQRLLQMSLDLYILYPFLKLTTLELNNIFGEKKNLRSLWVGHIIRAHSSTLVKLVLGNRKNHSSEEKNFPIYLPPVMKTLKVLEINLTKFGITEIVSYEEEFPALQSLTLTGTQAQISGKGWKETVTELEWFLPGQYGRSNTLEEFSLIGRPIHPHIKKDVLEGIYETFPMAEYHFDP